MAGRSKLFPQKGFFFHNDPNANLLAEEFNTRAITIGSDIFFASEQYQPSTSEGKKLIAHELTHVEQNQNNPSKAHVAKRVISTLLPTTPVIDPTTKEATFAVSNSDVVFILGMDQTCDTLYWFGALPGDHWSMQQDQDTLRVPFVVTDTATTVFDGISLRTIQIENLNAIYERIGSTWDMYMVCPNFIWDGPLGMRACYDAEISEQFSNYPCGSLVGLTEFPNAKSIIAFPNPVTDHLTIQLPNEQFSALLVDQTGREVI